MKLWHRRVAVGLAAVVSVVLGMALAQEIMPIEDLRMPLEHYENGRIRSQLRAKTAAVPQDPEKEIVATGVIVDFFTEEGDIEATVKAQDCTYTKSKQEARSEASVELVHPSAQVTGSGFEWKGETQTIKILRDVKVVLNLRRAGDLKERMSRSD